MPNSDSSGYTPRKRKAEGVESTPNPPSVPPIPIAPSAPSAVSGQGQLNSTSTSDVLASPGARLGAFVLEIIFAFVTLGIGWFIWSLIVWGKGTTPGHQVLKLYVVDAKSGITATWGHMALREFVIKGLVGGIASSITFGLYFLIDSLFIARDDRKTLHDLMSSTLVVQR